MRTITGIQALSNLCILFYSILATKMDERPSRGSFTVVDYGAADGTNSLPLITACYGKANLTVLRIN